MLIQLLLDCKGFAESLKSVTVYTAGEDGQVRAWKTSLTEVDQEWKSYKGSILKRRKTRRHDRYQPY